MPQDANPKKWSRLDNAAKIFPSTSEKTDTRVFRFTCELNEDVILENLQTAVDKAIKVFPDYACIMKKGIFWYYLEQSDIKPVVVAENMPALSPIYQGDHDRLLFEVSYFKNRINLEIYHVLSDGTGALQFFKTIVCNYIVHTHSDVFSGNLPEFDENQSVSDKSSDGFRKYYKKPEKVKKVKQKKAYHMKGFKNDDDALNLTEVIMSAKDVVAAAHKYNTTMTVFLTAIYIDSIHKEMSLADEKYPLVIGVPVNLRNFFPSNTAKNFFGMISVRYDFSERNGEFSDIIEQVDEQFKNQLTKEKLSIRMNKLAALEHNPFVKIAPLEFKNLVLKIARAITVRNETVVISNVGRIVLPEEFEPFINLFSVFASTLKLQLCLCSYMDKLSLDFTSAFENTAVQKNFVRFLTSQGVEAMVKCNNCFNEQVQADIDTADDTDTQTEMDLQNLSDLADGGEKD